MNILDLLKQNEEVITKDKLVKTLPFSTPWQMPNYSGYYRINGKTILYVTHESHTFGYHRKYHVIESFMKWEFDRYGSIEFLEPVTTFEYLGEYNYK